MNTRFALNVVLLAGAIIPAALLPSCAREYANYPPITGDDFAVKDVNNHNMRSAMTAALRWTVLRYPPPSQSSEAFAINLPAGASAATYDSVAEAIGHGAVPVSEENAKRLPVYHIARIWLRGTRARIDVVRPVFELPRTTGGAYVDRGVEIRLSGGWDPWHVTGSSEYEIGVLDAPPLQIPGAEIDHGHSEPAKSPSAPAPSPEPEPSAQQVVPPDNDAGESPKN